MLTDIDIVGEEIPFAESFPTSHDDLGPTEHLFVRITDGEHVGYGEGSALTSFTGETTATMETVAAEEFRPVLTEQSVSAALRAFREFAEQFPGHPAAKTGVEMALLDLRAKQAGVPLATLLGPTYRDKVSCVTAVGALTPGATAEKVVHAYDEGFRTFKVKADGDVDTDVERINCAIGALAERADPGTVDVRIDANTGWETYERARRAIEAIESPEYVEYVEQPVAESATSHLGELRRQLGVPVFADEAVHDLGDVHDLLRPQQQVSGICAKLAKTGSLLDVVTMSEVAAELGVPVTLISAFETSLGVAANIHLASALPKVSSGVELVDDLLASDPSVGPVDVVPTTARPSGPGIGVALPDALFA